MYLSLNWLKDFVKLPKAINPTDIAELLTLHIVEVESWKEQKAVFEKVVVGRVVSVAPHPNADRLRLIKVDIKGEILDIVCGAPNVAFGQKVPVALVGATLPNGVEIKESEIRGEKSYGMICAEDELGLGSDHEGIMVLSDKAKIGQSFADYLNFNDIILEIDNKSLSNRGDLWGHYGMARELSALLKSPLRPYLSNLENKDLHGSGKSQLDVKIEDKSACFRYIAVKINHVKAIESPRWLKERLVAVGARPINALVDITNYVMLESGQPLHAFDASGLEKISIRASKDGESLETLDEKERLLPKNSIVITDGYEPIALAGIMGGKRCAVNSDTESIILEAASFDAVRVRQTSQALNLRTDASMRFEKTLDPNLPELAWQRAWQLIKEIMPEAELAGQPVDIVNFKLEPSPIEVDFSWLKKRLGYSLTRKETISILERLGFKVAVSKNILAVIPPSWRAVKDVSIKEDILEEVARIVGYNNILSQSPISPLTPLPDNLELSLERKIQDILSGAGRLHEVYNYSFVSEAVLSKLNLDPSRCLRLANPISEQHVFLRPTLLAGLWQDARLNQFNFNQFGIFELGRIFLPAPGEYMKDDRGDFLPYQGKQLAMLFASQDNSVSFNRIKGLVNLLFTKLWPDSRVEFLALENQPAWSQAGQAVAVFCAGKELGVAGLLDNKLANAFGLKLKTAVVELNFKEIFELSQSLASNHYRELSKYPPVVRDVAFVVEEKILYNDFWRTLISFHPLLVKAELFDIYRGEALGSGRKSWAFHLTYQAEDRTLTALEIDAIQTDLVNRCHDQFEAQIRDF